MANEISFDLFLSEAIEWLRLLESHAPLVALGTGGVMALFGASMLAIGIKNKRTSDRSLEISEVKEKRLKPKLAIESIDGVELHTDEPGRLVGVHCRVKNQSDAPNSIVQVSLRIAYDVNQESASFLLPAGKIDVETYDTLAIPSKLSPGDALRGWCFFSLSSEMTRGWTITQYTLVCEDVHGSNVEQKSLIIRRES
jgi:hypothetical protein